MKKQANKLHPMTSSALRPHSSSKQHKLVYQLQCQISKKVLVPFGWCDLCDGKCQRVRDGSKWDISQSVLVKATEISGKNVNCKCD